MLGSAVPSLARDTDGLSMESLQTMGAGMLLGGAGLLLLKEPLDLNIEPGDEALLQMFGLLGVGQILILQMKNSFGGFGFSLPATSDVALGALLTGLSGVGALALTQRLHLASAWEALALFSGAPLGAYGAAILSMHLQLQPPAMLTALLIGSWAGLALTLAAPAAGASMELLNGLWIGAAAGTMGALFSLSYFFNQVWLPFTFFPLGGALLGALIGGLVSFHSKKLLFFNSLWGVPPPAVTVGPVMDRSGTSYAGLQASFGWAF